MINELLSRLTNWNICHANDYFKYDFSNADNRKGSYLWEQSTNGVFLWRDVAAHYFTNDGKVYKLTKKCRTETWENHNRFYDIVKSDPLCEIEIPIESKVIQHNNINLLYTIVQRPHYEVGLTIFNEALLGNVDTEYLLNVIDYTGILFKNLKKMNNIYNSGFPDRHLKIVNDSSNFFWSDFKGWGDDPRTYITDQIGKFYRTIYMLENSCGITINKKQLLTRIDKQWNI